MRYDNKNAAGLSNEKSYVGFKNDPPKMLLISDYFREVIFIGISGGEEEKLALAEPEKEKEM